MGSMPRLNVGCGSTPTEGWKNYDNSWSLRLARVPAIGPLFRACGLIDAGQARFIEFARHHSIQWADVTRRIPEGTHSVDVVYSSHMLEHLTPDRVQGFLMEARRVLRPAGILRLAVPDLAFHIANYMASSDADRFLAETHLVSPLPRSVAGKLRRIIVGDRHHLWMYDGTSLCSLLSNAGFVDAQVMPAGTTRIADSGPLNLAERSPESVFVEAVNP
jgi:SAM-dependent methyltransferase